MPDITLCQNDNCPIKTRCYRYKSKPDKYQSYAMFEYNDGCDAFISNKKLWLSLLMRCFII